MIFNATITGTEGETVTCRVFDPATGLWWDGTAWGDVDGAEITAIPYVGGGRFAGPVDYPFSGVIVEYLVDGENVAEEAVTVAAPVIPIVSSASSVLLTNNSKVTLRRGDSYSLPFSVGRDCTGWTAHFGAKRDVRQTNYDMPLRLVSFIDAAEGTGFIELTVADTAATGTYYGELELRSGVERNTPESYTLRIVEDVVR